MPRLESDERFWEIEREGRRLRVRSGRLGEPGEEHTRLAHYEAEAKRELDRRVAEKLGEGYRLVLAAPEPLIPADPALLAEVLAALGSARRRGLGGSGGSSGRGGGGGDPTLAQAWAVLGDWFAARGDVRGELIALDEALADAPSEGRAALRERRAALLDEARPRWLGELAKLDRAGVLDLRWDHGFIAAARIGTAPQQLELDGFHLGLRDLVPVLTELLANPLAALLRQLWIAELDPRGRRDLGRVLPELAARPRPALRRLELGAVAAGQWVRDELGHPRQRIVLTRIGSLAPLAQAPHWAPSLAALRIVGHELRGLGPLPQLRALELLVPSLTTELRAWLATSPWPRLERLWLRAARFHDPWAQALASDLPELLDHLARSPLRELGLQGPTALASYLDRAPRSRAPLRELRLFGLPEASVELLLAGHEQLAEIERIVVEHGAPHPRWAELLRRFGDRLRRLEPPPAGFMAVDELGVEREPIADASLVHLEDPPAQA